MTKDYQLFWKEDTEKLYERTEGFVFCQYGVEYKPSPRFKVNL